MAIIVASNTVASRVMHGGVSTSIKTPIAERSSTLYPRVPVLPVQLPGTENELTLGLGAEAKYDLCYVPHSRPIVN